MKRKVLALILAAMLLVSLTACGEGEETTVTGSVVSVEGTVLSIVQMDGNRGHKEREDGERPTMPEGETFPQRGENGERPELPEGETMPSMPEGGQMQKPSGENGGERPDMGSFAENMETTQIDIGDAHISVETDGVKASGTLADIKAGVFVTITMSGKGKATNVLVTTMSGFGGGFRGGPGGANADQQTN